MRLPALKKISREDLKDAPGWVSGIIVPFNNFAEAVYQALNKNISDDQNVACQIKEIVYTTPSTYPTVDDVQFLSGLKIKATQLFVSAAYDIDTNEPAAGPVYVPWQDNNGTIVIKSITGLAASKTYLIRLRIS
jgi:hypothetical protein